MAVENIGGLYNTKQPGYDDTADIQAALKAFLYGSYTYDTTSTDPTQLPNPSLAHHLQGLKNRIQAQEDLGIGSDYLTLAQIDALVSPTDGYIAMASDSTGATVQTTYGVALYQNSAPTTNLTNGIIWVDKDSENKDIYVYDSSAFVKVGTYTEAKGDLIVGLAAGQTDTLSVGSNGKVLTADSTAPLGITWSTLNYETDKNVSFLKLNTYPNTGTNGVTDGNPLKTSNGTTDVEVSITKSVGSNATKIQFSGMLKPTTNTNSECFVALQRKINSGSYSTVALGLINGNQIHHSTIGTVSDLSWIDEHGATTGDSVSYRLINFAPTGYSANTITQQFGYSPDLFMVGEI